MHLKLSEFINLHFTESYCPEGNRKIRSIPRHICLSYHAITQSLARPSLCCDISMVLSSDSSKLPEEQKRRTLSHVAYNHGSQVLTPTPATLSITSNYCGSYFLPPPNNPAFDPSHGRSTTLLCLVLEIVNGGFNSHHYQIKRDDLTCEKC